MKTNTVTIPVATATVKVKAKTILDMATTKKNDQRDENRGTNVPNELVFETDPLEQNLVRHMSQGTDLDVPV